MAAATRWVSIRVSLVADVASAREVGHQGERREGDGDADEGGLGSGRPAPGRLGDEDAEERADDGELREAEQRDLLAGDLEGHVERQGDGSDRGGRDRGHGASDEARPATARERLRSRWRRRRGWWGRRLQSSGLLRSGTGSFQPSPCPRTTSTGFDNRAESRNLRRAARLCLRAPRDDATSCWKTAADRMAAPWSSLGPDPRNASTAATDSHCSYTLMRDGSIGSAARWKSRHPGALRACSITERHPAR